MRDKETGKSKGYAFLKYEDQRSTDLAVDNLGGVALMGRVLKVDHTRYKRKDEEEELERERAMNEYAASRGKNGDQDERGSNSREGSEEAKRPLLPEERELAALIRDHDEDDPMKQYLVKEKKEEVANALARLAKKERKSADRKKHHHRHHHRRHRSRRRSRDPTPGEDMKESHRSRRRSRDSTPGEDRKEPHRSRRHSNDSESGRERRREDRHYQRRRSRSP